MTTTNTRGRQHRPTRADVADAWAHIREAAAAGNLQACGLVIQLADNAAPLTPADELSHMIEDMTADLLHKIDQAAKA